VEYEAGLYKITVVNKKIALMALTMMIGGGLLAAVEGDKYRLLSVSSTSKMILISHIPNKTKYVIDAATAKITVDGKPAEFPSLLSYSVVHVKFELKKTTKSGINLDGVATEIRILTPENPVTPGP
jgi:hypothetical protein